ncbi:MAG: glycosyltransferase [Candidatus Magasanikbacteria bacterium]
MFTLVIPIYNGGEYIPNMWKELLDFGKGHAFLNEVIFVNDGSLDNTKSLLQNLEIFDATFTVQILSHDENMGKGYALRKAVLGNIRAPYVGFTDVELPYGLEVLMESVNYLEVYQNVGVVIGKRKGVGSGNRQYSGYRGFAKKCFRLFLPKQLRSFSDTQSGLKVFRTEVARELFQKVQTNRWVFDLEILLAAKHADSGIHEIPVQIKPSCVGNGAIRFSNHGCKIIRDILKIHMYEKRGIYKST